MASIYHQNCVITGPADSYCLPCQTYLAKKEIDPHIATPAHKDSLEATSYVKLEEDRIRKVKSGYYCEGCNVFFQTLIKVNIHVKESDHVTNKHNHLIKEVDEGVIVFDDLLIDKRSWNGLDSDTCYVCNIDYCDEDEHKNDSFHILNIIQAELELKRDKYVFRKTDESFLNCIICNNLVNSESKDTHSEQAVHVNKYIQCQENKKKLVDIQAELKTSSSITNVGKVTEEGIKLETIPGKNDNCVQLNNNAKTENCVAEDSDKLLTPADALNRAKLFAKANKLKYKRNGTHCTVCDVRISSSLTRMKEHVEESLHKERSASLPTMTKKPMEEYVIHFKYYERLGVVIINFRFCLPLLNFLMITMHFPHHRCQSCEVSFNPYELETHLKSVNHENAMLVTPILTDFKTEFIREVRPGVYHCGFCDVIEGDWEGLQNHLKSRSHDNCKKISAVVLVKLHET